MQVKSQTWVQIWGTFAKYCYIPFNTTYFMASSKRLDFIVHAT